jgi:hypothetical protein
LLHGLRKFGCASIFLAVNVVNYIHVIIVIVASLRMRCV